MERLSPAVLVEVGDEIVEADRRGTRASAGAGVKAGVSPATQYYSTTGGTMHVTPISCRRCAEGIQQFARKKHREIQKYQY